MKRVIAVLSVALGLACVSIALGMLYLDYIDRMGILIKAEALGEPGICAETELLLEHWGETRRIWSALYAGTVGVALLGGGATLALFELPWFQQRTADA